MSEALDLQGRHIVLGLSGGIASFKSAELVRELGRQGATVQVVMTEAATQFITPVTMQALSNRNVYTHQWDQREPNAMAHINLTREADAVLVAPASADFMAKLAQGRADELLSLLCLARPIERCPLLLAPAMNREMWAHPATQRNVAQLRADGCTILGPAAGDQACGEIGDGRMLEALELCAEMVAFFRPKHLAGKRVLITAGPTFEAIDPVRGITNLSSGKMGFAIARAAQEAGAAVTLVAGPVALDTPRHVARRRQAHRAGDQSHRCTGLLRRARDGKAHLAAGQVGDAPHRVDGLEGGAGGDEHALAGQRLGLEEADQFLAQLDRFEHAAVADLAASLVAGGRAQDRAAVGTQLRGIALRRRVGPHLAVHRRRQQQRAMVDRPRQAQQAQQLVGAAL